MLSDLEAEAKVISKFSKALIGAQGHPMSLKTLASIALQYFTAYIMREVVLKHFWWVGFLPRKI